MDRNNQPHRFQQQSSRPRMQDIRGPLAQPEEMNQRPGMPTVESQPSFDSQNLPQPVGQSASQPNGSSLPPSALPSKRPLFKRWWLVLVGLCIVGLLAIGAVFFWYTNSLKPLSDAPDAESKQIIIEQGSTPDLIAEQLEGEGIIRSQTAFLVYTRLNDVRGKLQAGSYRLSPSESTPAVVDHLLKGQADEFSLTFYPGSALYINAYDTDQTPSHREVLENLGYSRAEIEAAFEAEYDHPLLADKPAGESVEGYIYGETYQIASGASVQDILVRSFDEMYARIEANNLLAAFEKRGMSLHQAVTLASVIEREVHDAEDQKQVAQIFYKRLEDGMPLGADATFVYAARMDGKTPAVNYDSPYNTRLHGGLPPGPIASPGITALQAVANPADGDYVYFVSGDDGKNYFSRTLAEHEANIARYCKANCALF